jgi:ABC-2 type transport system permease protein
MQIKNVFKRELYAYFNSPVAYIFLVIFLMITAWFTFGWGQFYESRQATLEPFFRYHPIIYLIFIPAISMRLWSEERKSGTIQLMFTLPITIGQAVLGKFIAAWVFLGIALFLTFPMVFTILYLGSPDMGVIFTSYLGSFLMAGAYLSIGSFTSALTKNQVVSFVISIVACFLILMAGFPMVTQYLEQMLPMLLSDLIASLSFWSHFESIKRGVIDLGDIFYFLSIMVFFLFATNVTIESKKAS